MSDPRQNKIALRAQVRAARRRRHSAQDASARTVLADNLRESLHALWLGLPAGTTVASFRSLPREPPTEQINADVQLCGHRLLVPHLLADNDLDWLSADDVPVGPAGIAAAQIILIPALAIDEDGGRLGQGGGSYDRALARARTDALLVAVLHDDEVVARVPMEEHDRRVHAVVTATGGFRRLGAADRASN